MPGGFHGNQDASDGIHIIQAFEFADATARTAYTAVSADIGKVARQADTGAFYILTAAPGTWLQLGVGGGGSTFSDSAFRVQDNADATKQVAFEVSDIATGTTRTITVPDRDVDLTDAVLVGGQIGGTAVSPTILGVRTTEGGGTNLTLGSVADGQVVVRSGTDLIGAAPGGGGGATFRGITGFGASDYLERAAGSALDGNAVTGFEAIAAALMPEDGWSVYATGHILSHRNDGASDGWALGVNGTRPEPGMSDGAGVDFGLFNFLNWQPNQSYKLAFYSVGTDLTDKRLTLNGQISSSGLGTGGYTDASGPLPVRVGRAAASGGGTAAFTGIVMGVAFKSTGLFTTAEIRGLIDTFLKTGSFGTTIPTHAYSAASLTPGAMPSTWPAAVGGLDFTLAGSLTVVDVSAVGPVETYPVESASLVITNGGLLTPGHQDVSAAGPTTITATFVLVDSTSNAVALDMPAYPPLAGECIVSDMFGQAGVNNITINAAGGQTINGGASIVISTAYESIRLLYDGVSRWTAGRITP